MEQKDLKNAWINIIENQTQTRTWDMNKTVAQTTIQEIVNELHQRSPSKQNRVHYQMHILNWSNTELRNKIFKIARDSNDPPGYYTGYCNSQTLAHWLFIFSERNRADWQKYELDTDQYIGSIEIGIASTMLIHSAFVRGLDCGLCRCFKDLDDPDWKEIVSVLGLDNSQQLKLMVGVGIKGKHRNKTKNLHTSTDVNIGINPPEWLIRPKPNLKTYVKWIL